MNYVRRHPGRVAVVGFAVGFYVGRKYSLQTLPVTIQIVKSSK